METSRGDAAATAWIFRRARVATARLRGSTSSTQVVPWPQAVYVGNDTMTACLPSVDADMQGILNRTLPGCVLPPLTTAFGFKGPHTVKTTPALCSVVNEIYADDVRLWRSRCGDRA